MKGLRKSTWELQLYYVNSHHEASIPFWKREKEKANKLGYKTFDGYIVDQYIYSFGKKVVPREFKSEYGKNGKNWKFPEATWNVEVNGKAQDHYPTWNQGHVFKSMRWRYYNEVIGGDVSWMTEYEKMRSSGWPYRVNIKNFKGNFIDFKTTNIQIHKKCSI